MTRLSLVTVLALGLAATAQAPPGQPQITLNASASGDDNGSGTGSVSGTITTPAPWQLSIHTVTVRYRKDGGSKTLNAFIPVTGSTFKLDLNMKRGGYSVWAVIDVKDADGHEKQIQTDPQPMNIP